MSSLYDLKDYAYPCMMAEKALRGVHDAMLKHDYDEAIRMTVVGITECARMLDAIQSSKERSHALRKQA